MVPCIYFSMDAWRMKQMKENKQINLQRRQRKLADLLEKERLEHTVSVALSHSHEHKSSYKHFVNLF